MNRVVVIYDYLWNGNGATKRKLEITDNNFVREDEATITIKETYTDLWDCERETETTYHKMLEGFVKNENEWYEKNMAELKERHEQILTQARTLK